MGGFRWFPPHYLGECPSMDDGRAIVRGVPGDLDHRCVEQDLVGCCDPRSRFPEVDEQFSAAAKPPAPGRPARITRRRRRRELRGERDTLHGTTIASLLSPTIATSAHHEASASAASRSGFITCALSEAPAAISTVPSGLIKITCGTSGPPEPIRLRLLFWNRGSPSGVHKLEVAATPRTRVVDPDYGDAIEGDFWSQSATR